MTVVTVKKLIEELKKYDGDLRVLLCHNGHYDIEGQEEVIGSCIQEAWNDEDEIIEEIVSLYDY